MLFLVTNALLLLTIVYSLNNVKRYYAKSFHRTKVFYPGDDLPSYEIPRWVHKKVFKHNKIPNYSQYKERQIEKENRMLKALMDEEENLYRALKECNLPMGLLQPISLDY